MDSGNVLMKDTMMKINNLLQYGFKQMSLNEVYQQKSDDRCDLITTGIRLFRDLDNTDDFEIGKEYQNYPVKKFYVEKGKIHIFIRGDAPDVNINESEITLELKL